MRRFAFVFVVVLVIAQTAMAADPGTAIGQARQALNEKRVELFDEFIHPEYNNHNAYVEPGPAGVKAFFRHYLDAFPDTTVVMDDVIEEEDRISARFTYNGTFSNPFMGYRPNDAAIQMRSIDIWRVKG